MAVAVHIKLWMKEESEGCSFWQDKDTQSSVKYILLVTEWGFIEISRNSRQRFYIISKVLKSIFNNNIEDVFTLKS